MKLLMDCLLQLEFAWWSPHVLLVKGFSCKWFLVEVNPMPIFFKGKTRPINGGQCKSAIFMYFLYFVGSKPSSLQFTREVLKPGIVKKCLVALMKCLFLN